MFPIGFTSPAEIARHVAGRARARRLALGLGQAELAERAGVNVWTLRRFERTGRIAFDALVRIAVVLEAVDGLGDLFPVPAFRSLDEVVERPERRRAPRRRRAP